MKRIRKTQPDITDLINQFRSFVLNARSNGSEVSFKIKPDTVTADKAVLSFSGLAYAKMITLVSMFDSEVGWHGVCHRTNPDKSEFLISDILVYPQDVTGTTVNTDQAKYETWLYGHDDEVFNNIRFHGHSHVNMDTKPSGVDIEHQNKLLNMLGDDDFYVFVIWNKKMQYTVRIFDMKLNILYETADVTLKVEDDDSGIFQIMKAAKDAVTEKSFTYYGNGTYYGTGYQGTGYQGAGTGYQTGNKTTTPAGTKTQIVTVQGGANAAKHDGKKKGTNGLVREDGYDDGWMEKYLEDQFPET